MTAVYLWRQGGGDTRTDCITLKICHMRNQRKCQHCGKTFAVRSGTQKYCCEACATSAKEVRRKRREDFMRGVEPLADLQQQEYFSFSKAALLMGCSRQYIYKLVAQGKLPASRLSRRMAIIRRADIEKMLAGCPYERVLPTVKPKTKARQGVDKTATPSTTTNETMEYYTAEEVINRFKIGQGWLYNCAKRYRIRVCRIAGHAYYSKHDIDEHFGVTAEVASVSEWLTAAEVKEQFGMEASAIRAYAYRHHIPTKKEFGTAYYSKKHLEELRRPDLMADEKYITIDEVSRIYGLAKANLHHIVKVKNIGKVKVGVRNLLVRADVERVMEERKAAGLPILSDSAMINE